MRVEREIISTTPGGPPLPASSADHLAYEPFRFRFNSAVCALITCATAAFCFFVGLLPVPWNYVCATLCLLPAPWLARRAFRISLVVTKDGVTVQNYWKTHRLGWPEIRGVGIGLKQQGGVAPQPALAFSLRNGGAVFAQATPLRQTPRREFMAAVLALAPSTVEALPDRAGVIGSDRALSNRFRLWWSHRGR